MTQNLDFDRPLDCDVAICGAELAGLIAGAILARRGLDVVVIDKPPQIGGGGGSTEHDGYWLDNGHRDGLDVTDLQVGWGYGQLAAQEKKSSAKEPSNLKLIDQLGEPKTAACNNPSGGGTSSTYWDSPLT